jgi:hypothetical protein
MWIITDTITAIGPFWSKKEADKYIDKYYKTRNDYFCWTAILVEQVIYD